MKILLVNDDGINAPGMKHLIDALCPEHELIVAAPDGQRSGFSQSVNYLHPVKVERRSIEGHEDITAYAVYGSPADCVKIALLSLVPDVDLVISGINDGENMGRDICYSGTFGAAMEGIAYGKKAIAISCFTEKGKAEFAYAAEFLRAFLEKTGLNGLPEGFVININIPNLADGKAKGVKITRQAGRCYAERYDVIKRDGDDYYQLIGDDTIPTEEGTDVWAVINGYVSISALKYDRTFEKGNEILKGLIK